MIVAAGGPAAAFAAKAATTTIPVVFIVADRPGQAWSCRQPRSAGRQPDRYQFFHGELAAKRLELLRELVPAALVLPCSSIRPMLRVPNATLRDVEPAAARYGAANPDPQRQHQPARSMRPSRLCARAARRPLRRQRPLFFTSRRVQLTHLAARHADTRDAIRAREFADVGGLMSYGASVRGCVASGWRLCRPHPQRRQADRPAGRTVEQVRARHQRPDRPDARPHGAVRAARTRRRGHRMMKRAGLHHASRRRGGRVAARGARATDRAHAARRPAHEQGRTIRKRNCAWMPLLRGCGRRAGLSATM